MSYLIRGTLELAMPSASMYFPHVGLSSKVASPRRPSLICICTVHLLHPSSLLSILCYFMPFFVIVGTAVMNSLKLVLQLSPRLWCHLHEVKDSCLVHHTVPRTWTTA